MTYKEALVECSKRVIELDDEKEIDLFHTLMYALKKQIPVKPRTYMVKYSYYLNYVCPVCGEELEDFPEFCNKCGQEIYWE